MDMGKVRGWRVDCHDSEAIVLEVISEGCNKRWSCDTSFVCPWCVCYRLVLD